MVNPSAKQVIDDFNRDPAAAHAKYNSLEYYIQREETLKQKQRGYYLNKKYKTSHDEYAALLALQNGACAICLTTTSKRRLAIDHDHETGKNRGLLCVRCNLGLGYFLDNKEHLAAAITYLEKHSTAQ